ncbi:hypothetical protein M5U04_12150 [Xenorhabdus sp. XENO-1]|uniref:hypothetical protein n=1 Tax=Xenorhabdus bovienii TaxID=40576 RepID=UPI0020CA5A1D|nr:hypothetical protein [Xenorhabdus bovienii]MCP9268821.1 hypothetical protein [Xenorhabdus bovienii subsp. africana]
MSHRYTPSTETDIQNLPLCHLPSNAYGLLINSPKAGLYVTLLNAIVSGRENESISRFNDSFQSIVTASNDTGE